MTLLFRMFFPLYHISCKKQYGIAETPRQTRREERPPGGGWILRAGAPKSMGCRGVFYSGKGSFCERDPVQKSRSINAAARCGACMNAGSSLRRGAIRRGWSTAAGDEKAKMKKQGRRSKDESARAKRQRRKRKDEEANILFPLSFSVWSSFQTAKAVITDPLGDGALSSGRQPGIQTGPG